MRVIALSRFRYSFVPENDLICNSLPFIHLFLVPLHSKLNKQQLRQEEWERHSSPCDAEGREHREWEKDYHEVTANHIVSAGESDKTQHFRPPLVTFYTQTARNSGSHVVCPHDFCLPVAGQ
jgi:hypothetical protein